MAGNLGQSVRSFLGKISSKKPKSSEKAFQRRLGLNLGRANIVASEVTVKGDQVILERCGRRPIEPEKPLAAQVKAFFQELGFESKRVRVSLKGQGVVVRYLSFPRMSHSEFASSIQYEAEKYLPFNMEDVILDYHFVRDDLQAKERANSMQVLLVAARKTEINRVVQVVQGAGLTPEVVDVDTFACVNAFERLHPEREQASAALVDFGAGDTTLSVLDHGQLAFSRDIAFGSNDAVDMIRRRLNVGAGEAARLQCGENLTNAEQLAAVQESLTRLFHELKLSLNYYFNQHQGASPVDAVYASGGFSQSSLLPDLCREQIELSLKPWDPTEGIEIGAAVPKDSLEALKPYLPVSIGLAIRS